MNASFFVPSGTKRKVLENTSRFFPASPSKKQLGNAMPDSKTHTPDMVAMLHPKLIELIASTGSAEAAYESIVSAAPDHPPLSEE